MTDTSKDLKKWKEPIEAAQKFAIEHGLKFTFSSAPYVLAKLTAKEVCIVIYPHKTKSTGNYHLRLRDENSRNKRRSLNLQNMLEKFYKDYWDALPDEKSRWCNPFHFSSKNILGATR